MASEVFCLVFLLVLLLQPSKVCFETKDTQDFEAQADQSASLRNKATLKVWLNANKNSSIAAIHSFSEDTKL
ncbi:hypothetical protein pdam_00019326 [Pocillopora damicornis]|uniref:Uncharacterized protein n=1 Tax=Pocillopora damicornis TaxID=46731 RepID=A0A3M6U198_POCDA|nr:hypothetical protein pdam_00019326 [Pocillopora damicornis]